MRVLNLNLNDINPGFKQAGARSSNKRTPEITTTVDHSLEEEGTDLVHIDHELHTPSNCNDKERPKLLEQMTQRDQQ